MSERTGIMDEAGKALSRGNRDDVEPLIRHMKEKPVATGLIILIVGFFLGKIL